MRILISALSIAVAGTAITALCEAHQPQHGVITLVTLSAPKGTKAKDLLNPKHPLWSKASQTVLQLTRTPPVYSTDPRDDGNRPKATAQTIRLDDGSVAVRLRWNDTHQDIGPQVRRYPDSGSKHIYKKHSESIDAFPDAASVMLPKARGAHVSYPALMMGDAAEPVDLYYWRADYGFYHLDAHGRASVEKRGQNVLGKATRENAAWTIVFVVPNLLPATPVSFAIWDGARGQRDGIKYFSLWYEVD